MPKWATCGTNDRMNQPQLGGVVPVWSMTDRLAKARTYASLSQQELADALGISERTVKRYEAGLPYKRGIILGWALACGVSPEWLESGTTDGNPVISGVTAGYQSVLAA